MIQYDETKVIDIKVSKEEYEKIMNAVVVRICCDDEEYKGCCIMSYVEEDID